MEPLTYRRKVNFYETDAQGIVHHSNYPRYFEEARGFYLDYIGYPYHLVRNELGVDIVLLELNVKYKKALQFGDEFDIVFKILDINKYFFTFEYKVIINETLYAEGVTRHCCLDIKTKKLVSVPPEILTGL